MTEITYIKELAQRLATSAKEDTYPVLSPADCGALVEALEKAQRRINELESRIVKLTGYEDVLNKYDVQIRSFAALHAVGIKWEAE